jgi:hypothetical protein
MDNIYNQDEKTRNSIVEIPEGYADDAGNTLMLWLSSFWRSIHAGGDMVKGLQQIRGIRLAQMYLDLLEILKLQDRNGLPVFHRELWHPFVIRRSTHDQAQENLLHVGDPAEIGPQPEGSVYGEGTVLKMGRLGNFEKYVTYPIVGGDKIVSINASITDNIIRPSIIMESGTDFVFRNSSIIFPRESDPFAEGSHFDVYDVPNERSESPEDVDAETVLWASDVLIDKDYVANHLSYAMGVSAPSTDVAKRIVNAAWDAVSGGPTPDNIVKLMAAMLNIPVVQTDDEKVIEVYRDDDQTQKVRTSGGTYSVYKNATLRSGIVSGAVLRKGELLDESLRVYPYLTNPDPDRVGRITGFRVPLDQDIPSIVLNSGMLRAKTEYGVYATWQEVPVEKDPVTGNLFFRMGGEDVDVRSFWEGVWDECAASGTDLSKVIGEERSMVSPAKFLLENLVGANTIFAVVDRSQLEDVSMMRDPMFFDMLCRVVPSAVRLFLVEHVSASGEDVADLGDTQEETFLAAQLGDAVDVMGKAGDRVAIRFVRPAPERIIRRKEEE